ncbi:hypothetical protein RchiOBHm_Chr4g0393061 [Rosa chinensis]|uniref:Uncharacterized protein n=1 Tax=Rosa chinensis TaxID=74649 RepID=A0A2P6QQV3_ROSCH|nr:hypothetical protein RchiOBHm_Chr4g0393061 [Rosa chinensis]
MIPPLCSFACIDLHANHMGPGGLAAGFGAGSYSRDHALLDFGHNHNHLKIVLQIVSMSCHLIASHKASCMLAKALPSFAHKSKVHNCFLPHQMSQKWEIKIIFMP